MTEVTRMLEALNLRGVYGTLCEMSILKTREERNLSVKIDSAFSKDVCKMCDEDIPDYNNNQTPVIVIRWEDFENFVTGLSSENS